MEIRGISSIPVNRTAASTSGAAAATGQPEPTNGAVEAKSSGSGVSAAGYISPFLRYDQSARVAVLYFRDVDTGETQSQIPSAKAVEEYRRAAGRLASRDEKPGSTDNTGEQDAGRTGTGSTSLSYGGTGNTGAGTGSIGGSSAGSTAGSPGGFGYAPAAAAGSYPAGGSEPSGAASAGSNSGTPDVAGSGVGGFSPPTPSGGGSSPSGSGGLVSVTV